MNTNEINQEFKDECKKSYESQADNTQTDKSGMTFVKMNMSREHMDFIMEHYGISSIVELNQASIYLMKSLAHMELDGYKFGMYKTTIVDGQEKLTTEGSFALNIKDMVQSLLNALHKENESL
jgi:hypothetical protein